jgi:Holliday junction resolvase RusA-like endonuclease
MRVKFKVLGEPKGKQRPRLCKIRGRSIVYTPKQTTEYEQKIRASCKRLMSEKFPQGIPLEIKITALFSIPKKFNKEQREKSINGELLPTKKPDGDNVIKIVLDALNDTAYFDDSQVCGINFFKKYGEKAQIIIEIKEIKTWEK